MIKKGIIRKIDWFVDIISLVIFQKQNFYKFTQKKNYKSTSFLHLEIIFDFNWVFWKKHSAMGRAQQFDISHYQTNFNFLPTTVGFLNYSEIVLYNFFSFGRDKFLLFIDFSDKSIQSTETLWLSNGFYEREASEMFGIDFYKKKDTRRLLLDYSNYTSPMKKDYSLSNSKSIRYSKVTDKPRVFNCNPTWV